MRPNDRKHRELFTAMLSALSLIFSSSVWALTIALSDDDGWDAIGIQAA